MKKWLFRLLVLCVTMIAFALFALNVVSGTSDTQKRGLEQAFSRIFEGNASFGTLKAFQIFPQLMISVGDLSVSRTSGGKILLDEVDIGFSFTDIIFKTRRIEKLHLKNLHVDAGTYLPMTLVLDEASIYKGDTNDTGKFMFQGRYGGAALKGQIDMVASHSLWRGDVAQYVFRDSNAFAMNIGSVQISGDFAPYAATDAGFRNLTIFAAKSTGKQDCKIGANKSFAPSLFFTDVVTPFADIKNPEDFKDVCSKVSQ